MTARPAGLVESAMLRMFTRKAEVLDVEQVGPAFCIVTLGGEALRGFDWTPGDKIQLHLGNWLQRTYTPMDWDGHAGRTRILVYRHAADGPGARWMRTVRPGDPCVVLGPRKSVRLAGPPSPVLLFGDETSLGLAAALRDQLAPPALRLSLDLLLEASSQADVHPVLQRLGLDGARVCVRQPDDAHFAALEQQFAQALQAHARTDVVLTGKAGSIQHLNRFLRRQNRTEGRLQAKAYWAVGKTGLD